MSLDVARRTLDRLVRANLIHTTAPGRYGLHDLLRAYAVRLGRGQEPDHDRRAALDRLFAYYLASAAAAVDRLHADEAWYRYDVPIAATALPDLADTEAARRWLDTERSCLVAVSAHAATHGWPSYAIGLSAILYPYLDAGGHHADALTIHAHGHEAARRAGDLSGEADTLRGLAMVHMRLGRYESALDHYGHSLELARQAEDRFGEVRALNGLGWVEQRRGRFGAAADHHRQALRVARWAEDLSGRSARSTAWASSSSGSEGTARLSAATSRPWPWHARPGTRPARPSPWTISGSPISGSTDTAPRPNTTVWPWNWPANWATAPGKVTSCTTWARATCG